MCTAEQSRSYRQKKWRWVKSQLGDCCSFCGATDRLELDHIDPSLKTYKGRTITKSYATLTEEMDNLRILCHNCHVKLTSQQVRNEEVKRGWKALYS